VRTMLKLPIHVSTSFVLVRPHYPENVGAAARAIKTMGFSRLVLVKPGRLASPDHEMAQKMAVKSRDVLDAARCVSTLSEAIAGIDWVVATTSRRGMSGAQPVRQVARAACEQAARGVTIGFLFGNEKTGLDAQDLELSKALLRIPMAADQPSINLAQAAQLVAYELFIAALEQRGSAPVPV
jgi:TrmH family RNA methyltransferase